MDVFRAATHACCADTMFEHVMFQPVREDKASESKTQRVNFWGNSEATIKEA